MNRLYYEEFCLKILQELLNQMNVITIIGRWEQARSVGLLVSSSPAAPFPSLVGALAESRLRATLSSE